MSIRCVFLRPTGTAVQCLLKSRDMQVVATVPLYEAEGHTYHIGHADMTDLNGNVWPPAPVGGIWHCDWLCGQALFEGERNFDWNPDGLVLCVRTPGGDWVIDGLSWNPDLQMHGKGWTRTGTPPDLTVTPSIDIRGKYHGWLRNGYLEPV